LDPTDKGSALSFSFSFGESDLLKISPVSSGIQLEIQSSINLVDWSTVGSESYQLIGDEIEVDLQSFLPDRFFRILLTETAP